MNDYRPPSFSMFPPVVKNLLIINFVFFLGTIAIRQLNHIDITNYLGLHYFESSNFKIYQPITYLFLHDISSFFSIQNPSGSSIMHILSNMFALWMFGSVLENYWGGKRFIIFYLICGIGAALTQEVSLYVYFHHLNQAINMFGSSPTAEGFNNIISNNFQGITGYAQPITADDRVAVLNEIYRYIIDQSNTIGASGAIFGILLAYCMSFPNTEIYLYFAIPVKAKYFVILYGLFELYSGIKSSTGDNVAHFAHLGGMLFGFILIMYWRRKRSI